MRWGTWLADLRHEDVRLHGGNIVGRDLQPLRLSSRRRSQSGRVHAPPPDAIIRMRQKYSHHEDDIFMPEIANHVAPSHPRLRPTGRRHHPEGGSRTPSQTTSSDRAQSGDWLYGTPRSTTLTRTLLSSGPGCCSPAKQRSSAVSFTPFSLIQKA